MSDAIPLDLTATYGELRVFDLLRVHDGDTAVIEVQHWPRPFRTMALRMFGWDAPELGDLRPDIQAIAVRARDRLAELFVGRRVMKDLRRDKYFRLLADFIAGDKDVSQTMASEGLLRPYSGQGPKPW